MSANKKGIKRRQRLALGLVVAIALGAIVVAWLGNRGEQTPEAPVEHPDCNRFLFIEQRTDAGDRTFFVLVQVKVTPEGLDRQELRLPGKLDYHWQPAYVTGGKVYGMGFDSLQAVDLRTGAVETVRPGTERKTRLRSRVSHYYVDGKFYAVVKWGGKPTMRIFDLRRRIHRDIMPFRTAPGPSWPFAISPDQQRVAYFVSQPSGPKKPMFPPAWLTKSINFVLRRPAPAKQTFHSYYQLSVMYTDTGESEKLAAGTSYSEPSISSFSGNGPPFFWLDAKRILCLSNKEQPGANPYGIRQGPHCFRIIDVTTGEQDDIGMIPAHAGFTRLFREPAKATASVRARADWFTLDRAGRKLAEGRASGNHYRMRRDKEKRWVLSCDERALLRSGKDIEWRAAPNGKRVLWLSRNAGKGNQIFVDGEWVAVSGPGKGGDILQYHAVGETDISVIGQGSFDWNTFLWYADEDLEAAPPAGELAEGWLAFGVEPKSDSPQKPPAPRTPRPARRDISKYLTFAVKIDKQTYRLHDPIELTVTLKNISNEDQEVLRPVVFDGGGAGGIVEFTLAYPGGSRSVDCGAGPYEPKKEYIVLKAGQSVTTTGTLEVSKLGDYVISMEYKGWGGNNKYATWRGSVRSAKVGFKVIESEDEAQLFDKKLARLLARFRAEVKLAPTWPGANNTTGDEMVGLPGLGSRAVMPIIEAFRKETNFNARKLLLRPVTRFATPALTPKVIPLITQDLRQEPDAKHRDLLYQLLRCFPSPAMIQFFRERLLQGQSDEWEHVSSGLLQLWHQNIAREEAMAILLETMNHENAAVRRVTARRLASLYIPRVEECFAKAVADPDHEVRLLVSRYLAGAEWLELSEWFELAAREPTAARYIAACSFVPELEQKWHVERGRLPRGSWRTVSQEPKSLELFRQTMLSWAAWAREYPDSSSRVFERVRKDWPKPKVEAEKGATGKAKE
ncbi:HEAT repeat domain-containing protein [Candidatus Sumerlaeota bacterium]